MTKVRHYKSVGYGQSPEFRRKKYRLFGPDFFTFLGPDFHFFRSVFFTFSGPFFRLFGGPDFRVRAIFALRDWRGGHFCLKAMEGGSISR